MVFHIVLVRKKNAVLFDAREKASRTASRTNKRVGVGKTCRVD